MLGRNTAALLSDASVQTQENLQGALSSGSHFRVPEMKALTRFKPNFNIIHFNQEKTLSSLQVFSKKLNYYNWLVAQAFKQK